MAFALKVASTSQPSSSSPAPVRSSPHPRLAVAIPGRRKAVAAIRAVAVVAPTAPPAPAKHAGKRCLPVSQTMSRLMAQGKVRAVVCRSLVRSLAWFTCSGKL
jgi:indole-3-glycerol-phosphate lyase